MPTNYAGSDLSYPANVPLPNDGEPAAAAFLNPAWQRLADRTAYLKGMADRERTGEVTKAVDATLTVAEQLVYLSASKRLTLPAPALAVGRLFRVRLGAAVVGRMLPNAAETINGVAGGFPMSRKGAVYTFFTPDGVNWLASLELGVSVAPSSWEWEVMTVFYESIPGPGTCEVYGSGFKRLTDSVAMGYAPVTQNGFDIATVGGSWTYHDDGWITIVTGGGGGGCALHELLTRDPEDAAYDGTTERVAGEVNLALVG